MHFNQRLACTLRALEAAAVRALPQLKVSEGAWRAAAKAAATRGVCPRRRFSFYLLSFFALRLPGQQCYKSKNGGNTIGRNYMLKATKSVQEAAPLGGGAARLIGRYFFGGRGARWHYLFRWRMNVRASSVRKKKTKKKMDR
jgi:hypothetical protein